MSTNIKNLSKAKKDEALLTLFSMAKSIKGDDGVESFITHLLTESEQITIGRRLLIARMLLAGSNRAEIRSKLQVSPNTFCRTRTWLNKQIPNYSDVLKEFEKQEENRATKRKKTPYNYIDPVSFKALRHKYPLHFLLFNIFLP